MKAINKLIILIVLATTFTGCWWYKFSYSTLQGESITIKYFPNHASIVNPTLSQAITDGLKDKFMSQTKLIFLESNADILLEGKITGYNITPQAILSNETAALNKLTITLKVSYTNKVDSTNNFTNKSYSEFYEYESSKNLSEVETELIEYINEKLIDAIYRDVAENW